uniref:Uncharacterized protein n=1 Tax=Arcella intermedia TaxID=1963864 RepID=A0A6B2L757_9EUKA
MTIAGIVVMITISISIYLILKHLLNYTRPESQRCIIRILFMVPLYSLYSYLGLFFYDYQVYFAIFRDCYEAYALYMFFVLCSTYLGGWEEMATIFEQLPPRKCLEPLCCISIKPSRNLLRWCQRGILQYALIRPLVTIISVILLIFQIYDDGAWRLDRGWLWMTIINNIGVTVSLYCLVLFYQIAKADLKPYKPLIKFGVIKGIVFFCYWQSVVLMAIVALGWIPKFRDWDHARIGTTLQNLLICFEMLIFAFLYLFAFPYDIYQVNTQTQAPLVHEFELNRGVKGLRKGVKDSINQKDMVHDTFDAYAPGALKKGQLGPIKKNKFKRADKDPNGDELTLQSLESEDSDEVVIEQDAIESLEDDNTKIKTARR